MRVLRLENMLAVAALAMTLAALIGCGGSGGDNLAGGGIGGTGVTVAAVGTVSDFGSVIVNDVEYTTSDAEVVVERDVRGRGDVAVTTYLSRGMIVRIEGLIDENGNGEATRVVYNDNVEGPVERITPIDDIVAEIVVMGQTVLVDDQTVFHGIDLAAIGEGNVVEVSGLVDTAGTLFASYVRKKADSLDPNIPVDLKGVVQNLDASARTFTINSLTIDYSSAALSGFSGTDPLPGRLVEVDGRLINPDTMLATRVAAENELGPNEVDSAELDGFITQFSTVSQFRVGSIDITTDSATVLNDVSPDDLQSDTRLIVRGPLTNGTILADEIRFPEKIKLESNVEAVDIIGGSITLRALSPIQVLTSAATKIVGASGLDKIQSGDHVKIFAKLNARNEVVATKVLVKPGSETAGLKGTVEVKTAPVLLVLGVTIDTSPIPEDGGFIDKNGRAVTSFEFFGSLIEGQTVVNARGTLDQVNGEWRVVWNAIDSEQESIQRFL